jgi:hypothetical protein
MHTPRVPVRLQRVIVRHCQGLLLFFWTDDARGMCDQFPMTYVCDVIARHLANDHALRTSKLAGGGARATLPWEGRATARGGPAQCRSSEGSSTANRPARHDTTVRAGPPRACPVR